MKTKSFVGLVFKAFIVLIITMAPFSFVYAGSSAKAKGPITAINVNAGSVTISDKKLGLVTVFVDTSTTVEKNSQQATLADLQIGDRADARYNATTFIANKLKVKSPEVKGTITAIDLATNTITVTPDCGTPLTLNITVTTDIDRNSVDANLVDLQIGDFAEVRFDPSTNNAFDVDAFGP
ncbi:MAG TPA: DUF5666 domain-containing protein [Acidobacteriota bacterium]|jgi:hypothetical protein|nr:DUF5666 domain-containing protein [Acidobacteriota bacterium]